MNSNYTVFYDKSCKLCKTEIEALGLIDFDNRLRLVDCSALDFNEEKYCVEGVLRKQMLESLHLRDENGNWFKGVDAFKIMYTAVGLPGIGNFWGGRYTRIFTKKLYPIVVRNRYWLSRTGLVWGMEKIGKVYAWKAFRNSQKCKKGLCETHYVTKEN